MQVVLAELKMVCLLLSEILRAVLLLSSRSDDGRGHHVRECVHLRYEIPTQVQANRVRSAQSTVGIPG